METSCTQELSRRTLQDLPHPMSEQPVKLPVEKETVAPPMVPVNLPVNLPREEEKKTSPVDTSTILQALWETLADTAFQDVP